MVWPCDEKRGPLRRKEGDENESTEKKEERSPQRRWLDRYDIKEKGLPGRKCRPTNVLHRGAGLCDRTATLLKSGNKMKRKKKTKLKHNL